MRGVVGGLRRNRTQKGRVLDYLLEHGSISTFEAYTELGVTQLAARIFELKEDGYRIQTEKRIGCNRYGERVLYVSYYLSA